MKYIWFILLLLLPAIVEAQTNTVPSQKEITSYTQTWISINSAFRFSNRWGAVGDFHFRSDNFFKNDYFYFARVGGVYWVKDRMHPRWKNKIDIYMGVDVKAAKKWGRKKVTIEYGVLIEDTTSVK